MKPRAILIADVHLDKNTFNETIGVAKQAFDYAKENNIKKVIILGDLFTTRTGQTLFVLLSFLYLITLAEDYGLELHLIPGNHDKTNLDDTVSYLDVFSKYEHVELYSEESIVKVNGDVWCFLPYFRDDVYLKRLKRLKKWLRDGHKFAYNNAFLFTHKDIDGVVNNDGSIVSNNVQRKLFKIFKKVFVGHYHNKQKIGNNVFFIGSLRPINFGEDNRKGFVVLYDNGEHKQIRPNFKKFLKIKIDVDEIDKQQLANLVNEYKEIEHCVRFKVSGKRENIDKIDFNVIRSLGIDVEAKAKEVLRSIKAAERGEIVKFDVVSVKKSFVEYCSDNEIKGKKRVKGLKYLKFLEC